MVINSTHMIVLSSEDQYDVSSWKTIIFWLYSFGEFMSIPCYLFNFYHLFGRKVARKTTKNHTIIALLIFNFIQLTTDLSLTLDFLRVGYKSLFISGLCIFQAYVDFGIWYGALFLMLWMSIERHILIFHSTFAATARRRFLFHYTPLAIFGLYAPILYFYLIVLCSCTRVYNPLLTLCGAVCFYSVVPAWFVWYEALVNYVIPVLLIAVFSFALVVRVIVQKRRLQQANTMRRNRKMVTQLMFVSAVYLIFDLPYVIIYIVQWLGIPNFHIYYVPSYIIYLTYVPAIMVPYAALMELPDLKKKLRALIIWKAKRNVINPIAHLN